GPIDATRSAVSELVGGDRLDLHELVRVTQNRDAEQRARSVVVTEVAADDVPGSQQVLPLCRGDIDRRFDHIRQPGSGGGEGGAQIGHHLLGLAGDVAYGDDGIVLIDRTGTGRE